MGCSSASGSRMAGWFGVWARACCQRVRVCLLLATHFLSESTACTCERRRGTRIGNRRGCCSRRSTARSYRPVLRPERIQAGAVAWVEGGFAGQQAGDGFDALAMIFRVHFRRGFLVRVARGACTQQQDRAGSAPARLRSRRCTSRTRGNRADPAGWAESGTGEHPASAQARGAPIEGVLPGPGVGGEHQFLQQLGLVAALQSF